MYLARDLAPGSNDARLQVGGDLHEGPLSDSDRATKYGVLHHDGVPVDDDRAVARVQYGAGPNLGPGRGEDLLPVDELGALRYNGSRTLENVNAV